MAATKNHAGYEPGNKAQFVRQFSPDTPVLEIAEKATLAGLSITAAYVYRVRALDRDRQAKAHSASGPKQRRAIGGKKPKHRTRKTAVSNSRPGASKLRAAEHRFMELVLELGFARSYQLVERVRNTVESVLG
jgi:hypothetical protein